MSATVRSKMGTRAGALNPRHGRCRVRVVARASISTASEARNTYACRRWRIRSRERVRCPARTECRSAPSRSPANRSFSATASPPSAVLLPARARRARVLPHPNRRALGAMCPQVRVLCPPIALRPRHDATPPPPLPNAARTRRIRSRSEFAMLPWPSVRINSGPPSGATPRWAA